MPYGIWHCADGLEVLFNRYYHPLLQRYPGKPAQDISLDYSRMNAIDYSLKNTVPWIHWDRQEWFFNDGNPPWRSKATLRKCEEILATWGQLVWCPCHRRAWRTEVGNWPWYYFIYPITKKDRKQDPSYKDNDKFDLRINPTRYQDRAAIPLAIPFPDKISAMKFAQQHMDMKAEPINYIT
jgi:hypothetical protein